MSSWSTRRAAATLAALPARMDVFNVDVQHAAGQNPAAGAWRHDDDASRLVGDERSRELDARGQRATGYDPRLDEPVPREVNLRHRLASIVPRRIGRAQRRPG